MNAFDELIKLMKECPAKCISIDAKIPQTTIYSYRNKKCLMTSDNILKIADALGYELILVPKKEEK